MPDSPIAVYHTGKPSPFGQINPLPRDSDLDAKTEYQHPVPGKDGKPTKLLICFFSDAEFHNGEFRRLVPGLAAHRLQCEQFKQRVGEIKGVYTDVVHTHQDAVFKIETSPINLNFKVSMDASGQVNTELELANSRNEKIDLKTAIRSNLITLAQFDAISEMIPKVYAHSYELRGDNLKIKNLNLTFGVDNGGRVLLTSPPIDPNERRIISDDISSRLFETPPAITTGNIAPKDYIVASHLALKNLKDQESTQRPAVSHYELLLRQLLYTQNEPLIKDFSFLVNAPEFRAFNPKQILTAVGYEIWRFTKEKRSFDIVLYTDTTEAGSHPGIGAFVGHMTNMVFRNLSLYRGFESNWVGIYGKNFSIRTPCDNPVSVVFKGYNQNRDPITKIEGKNTTFDITQAERILGATYEALRNEYRLIPESMLLQLDTGGEYCIVGNPIIYTSTDRIKASLHLGAVNTKMIESFYVDPGNRKDFAKIANYLERAYARFGHYKEYKPFEETEFRSDLLQALERAFRTFA